MRRKLTGTLFYGACLVAIGILLLALVVLLLDVLARGLPWLDPRVPDRGARRGDRTKPASCPPSSARSRSASSWRCSRFPIGVGRRDLPHRVRPRQLAQPAAPDEHQQPRRRARRSSTASSGWPSSSGCSASGRRPGGGPDPDPAHPAGRDHRLDRGAQGRARGPARGRLRPRRDALADGPRLGPPGRGARAS